MENQTFTLTVEETAHRNAISFLKGFIIGYSVARGFKWSSTKDHGEMFAAGMNAAKLSANSWYAHVTTLVAAHIAYNRLRHNRSHMASKEAEAYYMEHTARRIGVLNMVKDLYAATGFDVLAILF